MLEKIKKWVELFKSWCKDKNVRIFSHFDADGLTSASIFIKAMIRENINFHLSVEKQLTKEVIGRMEIDESNILVLLDFGSGQVKELSEILKKTKVLILDHHQPSELSHPNLLHINPLLLKEDGISSSLITYLFVKCLNEKNSDLVELAITGALGDQLDELLEKNEIAKHVVEEGVKFGKVEVSNGIKIYGWSSRPLHKALEYSLNPYIPNVSGSESNAVQFLAEIGIELKKEGEWRKLKDLSLEEQKKLASAIVIERLREKYEDADKIFGKVYILPNNPEELQDAREFATLINACGRLGKYDLGIRLCLGDFTVIGKAWEVMNEYRKKIAEIIEEVQREKGFLLKTANATFLFGKEKIPDTLIGTITSILLNSNLVDNNKPIFGIAKDKGRLKISARVLPEIGINLKEILTEVIQDWEGEAGGHELAAGAYIPEGKEKEFINRVDKLLGEINGKKA